MDNVNIAIFASGSGTNAENIIRYFSGDPTVQTKLVLTNREDAYVLKRAIMLEIPGIIFSANELREGSKVDEILSDNKIDYIILAGFLLKVPDRIVSKFRGRIINVHPALLPKFGGKGMYGHRVHQAVVDSLEKESGITIHLVDEVYDNGETLFQAKCKLDPDESAETLAAKIHQLEKEHFPRVIGEYIKSHLAT
ncbi:MAG: phosphoribosylglycinamide formyltransferase [Bacteroidetes bacterium HGW-Bacteroidetes-7]|jgi:phosphoribosylglycinamide formyltransferase-1|nr:MAG: phosphoribosylglycinamide formyltransferase [Bacteroidetes bacterium HGW-Bacteroidetes-7]